MNRLRAIIPLWRLERFWDRLVRLTWPKYRIIDERDSRYLRQILAYVLREDSCCVDVGCNEGAVLREFLRLAPKGKHYAFEPLPQFAKALEQGFPGVQIFSVALSDTRGESPFAHSVTDSAWSGLRLTHGAEQRHLDVETIMVKTCLMDDVIPEKMKIDFIKIDVEGAELQVLRGGRRTIERCRPFIVFEHGGHAAAYGTTAAMVHALLAEYGLRVFGLDGSGPLSRDDFTSVSAGGKMWNFLAKP